jgi:hypothetical protein
MNSKRGDISIGLIFSIVITIIGIMLLLILAGKTSDGKKFYCELSNKYTPRFYSTRMDSFCYGVTPHNVEGISSEQVTVEKFSDSHSYKLFHTKSSQLSSEFNVTVNRDAVLKNASISITAPHNRSIKTFEGGEYNVTLPPYPFSGGTESVSIRIPKYAIIRNASVELYGANYPLSTDIAFAIDTSGSMTNEWNSVCSIVSNVTSALRQMKVKQYRIRVYRIGTGRTFEVCPSPAKNLVISTANLSSTNLPLYDSSYNFIRDTSNACCFNIVDQLKVDDYTEVWGVASYYLSGAAGEDAWLEDSKRIEVLISDSDPTGAVATRYCWMPSPPCTTSSQKYLPQTVQALSGHEEEVIEQAKNKAIENNIFVSIIYGDDDPQRPEGFSIGCPDKGGCCLGSPPSCYQIIDWMDYLASKTGGKVFGFKDRAGLMAAVKDMVISNYPNQIGLSIDGGNEFASRSEELNSANSPWKVSGDDFVNSLQNALASCVPDDEGFCTLKLEVTSGRDGTIILSNLKITYDIMAKGVFLSLEGKQLMSPTQLNAETKTVDFTNEILALEKNCNEDYCIFSFKLSSAEPTELIAENLKLTYQKFFIKENLASTIADCWTKARFGQEKSDFFCQELPIPLEYKFIRPITEADIANVLKARQWCHIIGDSDYGCGDSDSIKFTQNINTHTNILIEYKAGEKAVVVS